MRSAHKTPHTKPTLFQKQSNLKNSNLLILTMLLLSSCTQPANNPLNGTYTGTTQGDLTNTLTLTLESLNEATYKATANLNNEIQTGSCNTTQTFTCNFTNLNLQGVITSQSYTGTYKTNEGINQLTGSFTLNKQ